jgi:hypothetical protein
MHAPSTVVRRGTFPHLIRSSRILALPSTTASTVTKPSESTIALHPRAQCLPNPVSAFPSNPHHLRAREPPNLPLPALLPRDTHHGTNTQLSAAQHVGASITSSAYAPSSGYAITTSTSRTYMARVWLLHSILVAMRRGGRSGLL